MSKLVHARPSNRSDDRQVAAASPSQTPAAEISD
jgi:hypothetical protein